MAYASERLAGAQRSLIETSQDIGIKGIEGATRLFHLNLQTMSGLWDRGVEPVESLTPSGTTMTASGMQASALLPGGRAMASYTREAAEIVSSTNGEIARLLQQNVLGWQSLAREMLSATASPPAAARETLQAMMRNPVAAMQWTFQQLTGTAAEASTGSASAPMEGGAAAPSSATQM